MIKHKFITAYFLSLSAMAAIGMSAVAQAEENGETLITLGDETIEVNGSAIGEDGSVYAAHDIIYYEDKDAYESGNPYGEGEEADKHTEEEADAHTVVHITEPGTYRITGTLSQGQIAVDLGDDAKEDPDAKVTLIMDNADITCTVAPAVIFYEVYECDTAFLEGGDDYAGTSVVDTAQAGANVILADGSVNNINGSYVAKIYKDEEGESKKYKYDGAFYSRMSMNIDGEETGDGVLNITAANEGLDSELHLTINGGVININSQDDGVNTNEDGISVTTINGGTFHICGGLGTEGDGIDSNGYLVINGGTVIASANPASDSGLDSDLGSFINGGTVIATGSTMDWAESDSDQVTMNLQFSEMQGSDEAIIITDADKNPVFAYGPDQDETSGTNARGYQGAIISTPALEVGADYLVYVGGTLTGSETNGIYDTQADLTFQDAAQMQYTGTQLGGPGAGMQMPEGFDPNNAGDGTQTPPEGFDPSNAGDGTQTPPEGFNPSNTGDGTQTPPEGFNPSNTGDGTQTPPEKPESTDMTEGDGQAQASSGNNPPEMPENASVPAEQGSTQETAGEASAVFTMTDKVNAFSNVTEVQE